MHRDNNSESFNVHVGHKVDLIKLYQSKANCSWIYIVQGEQGSAKCKKCTTLHTESVNLKGLELQTRRSFFSFFNAWPLVFEVLQPKSNSSDILATWQTTRGCCHWAIERLPLMPSQPRALNTSQLGIEAKWTKLRTPNFIKSPSASASASEHLISSINTEDRYIVRNRSLYLLKCIPISRLIQQREHPVGIPPAASKISPLFLAHPT